MINTRTGGRSGGIVNSADFNDLLTLPSLFQHCMIVMYVDFSESVITLSVYFIVVELGSLFSYTKKIKNQ